MELVVIFLVALSCIILPIIVALPLMVKYNNTWRVPAIFCCCILSIPVLLAAARYLVHNYILDVTEYTIEVCEPVKRVDIKWK